MANANRREKYPEAEVGITRLIKASRATVFSAWTDPAQLARWWGPAHFTNPVCEADARPGGRLFIVMRAPDGTDYPMRGEYIEVKPPERLVFKSFAIGKEGETLLEGETTVTFHDENGATKLVVHSKAIGYAPMAPQMLAGMEAGWTGSIDKLETMFAPGA